MDPPKVDPHLGVETIAKTVREARARIPEHANQVDATLLLVEDDSVTMQSV
jgi:hypothetical protein